MKLKLSAEKIIKVNIQIKKAAGGRVSKKCLCPRRLLNNDYLNVKFLCQSPEADFEDSRKVPQRQTQGGFKDVS